MTYKNYLKSETETDKNEKLHQNRQAETYKEKGQVPIDELGIEKLDKNLRLQHFTISPLHNKQHSSTENLGTEKCIVNEHY